MCCQPFRSKSEPVQDEVGQYLVTSPGERGLTWEQEHRLALIIFMFVGVMAKNADGQGLNSSSADYLGYLSPGNKVNGIPHRSTSLL